MIRDPLVLVVDDNADNLHTLQSVLRRAFPGGEILIASDAEEGLEIARNRPLDVALVDVQMPGVDGVEMCRRLKRNFVTRHIGVILITSHQTSAAVKAMALEAEADEFISRPVESADLVARVNVSVRMKRQEDRLRQHGDEMERLAGKRLRELEASEERYRCLVNDSPDLIFTMALDGAVEFMSPRTKAVLGHAEEKFLGKGFPDIIHPDDRDAALRLFRDALAGCDLREVEYRILDGDGMVRWLRHTATVVRPADRDPFILNTVRDVSAAKAAQESRDKIQRLEALGVLAGGIAHDFNNMLTGILANLSLSQDPAISREQAAMLLHEAESAAHAAKQLVQQLMTFARGGAPALTSTLPGPLIADAVRFASRGSACQVVLTLADPMPPILCDAGQVTQVLHNLVLNGIEAMAGAGTLTVSAEYVDLADRAMAHLQAGRYLRIDVQDQGKGIRREDLVNVFDPYYSTKESGRGLGLATSHSIIRRHGGHMDVESREGGGSRFTVYLPATDEPTKPQAAFAAQPHAGSGRALVMDDEPMVVTVLSRIMARLGYESEAVGDGVAALAAYERASSEGRPFSVVFMDLTIPGGMGGEEAVGKLKLLDPGARVIACSGYSEAPVMTSFETYGFAGVLRKPFTPAEVSAALAASGVGAPR